MAVRIYVLPEFKARFSISEKHVQETYHSFPFGLDLAIGGNLRLLQGESLNIDFKEISDAASCDF
jgi:hypothetical protein